MTNEQVLKILSEPPPEEPLHSLTLLLASLTDALDASLAAWDHAGPRLRSESDRKGLFAAHQSLVQANDIVSDLYFKHKDLP